MPSKNSGAGMLAPPPGMGPKEKKYAAHMVTTQLAAANRSPSARSLASWANCAPPGFATMSQASSARTAPAGKKPSAVNLESAAAAPARPRNTDLFQVGASAHRTSEKKARPRQAAKPMSVVASPACAGTGGTRVNSNVASAASGLPKMWRGREKKHQPPRPKGGQKAEED